ncbi:MAG: hypothetical protein K2F94_08620 [Muribaculaceae bacterium]|nr:hypothetical protein [Muribaculaceae bacterium]
MELTERILCYVVLSAFICYLVHGCYKTGRDMVAYANMGSRMPVMICGAVLIFLLSGIALSAFTIYAVWSGDMPGEFGVIKTWFRPVFSVVTSGVILFFVACVAIDLVGCVRVGNRREILITAGKMVAMLGIGTWLLMEKWEWIFE